jgi:hypothetical protein
MRTPQEWAWLAECAALVGLLDPTLGRERCVRLRAILRVDQVPVLAAGNAHVAARVRVLHLAEAARGRAWLEELYLVGGKLAMSVVRWNQTWGDQLFAELRQLAPLLRGPVTPGSATRDLQRRGE